MTLHTHQHPPTPTGTQCRYLPDFEIFKGIFLGTSRTESNCYGDICPGDICPGNICPGDICPYQEYLSCYRLYFDQTLEGRLVRSRLGQGRSSQGQGKVGTRLGQGHGKVKARSRTGQGKDKARSGQGQGKVKARSKQGQGKV